MAIVVRGGRRWSPSTAPAEWSDILSPARQYNSEADLTADWPTEALAAVVDLSGYSSDFYAAAWNQCNASATPIILRLPAEKLHLTSFPLAGSSGSQTFAFGFYHPKWRGFLGRGPGLTTVQQDANSMSAAQITALESMSIAAGNPNQMGMFLAQPTGAYKVFFAGLTVQAADQQNLTMVASDLQAKGIVTPQPAPHHGIVVGPNKDWQISHAELLGAGRAVYPAPPFEHTNFTSQYSKGYAHHVWSDGRRAADIDPARPRRCNPWMQNSEDMWQAIDCRFDGSNISRVAINNQGTNTEVAQGPYTFTRVQIDNIGNHNIDPALNSGVTLGGYSQAVCLGVESYGGEITVDDCTISVDNPYTDGSISQHVGLNIVAGVNPQGGRLRVYGGRFHNTAFPWLDDWLCVRISQTSYWYTDGPANTIFVYAGADATTPRKQPWLYTGAWNESAMLAAMTAGGVNMNTHYLLRNTVT